MRGRKYRTKGREGGNVGQRGEWARGRAERRVDEMKDTMASGRKVGQSGERKEGQERKKGRTYTKIEKQTGTEKQEKGRKEGQA